MNQQRQQQQQQPLTRRNVVFDSVEVIELPYTIGDNPSVSGGVPIAPSWNPQKRTRMDLKQFEEHRPIRRQKRDLHLSEQTRNQLLLDGGYSLDELYAASREAHITRRQRLETIQEWKRRLQEHCTAMSRINDDDECPNTFSNASYRWENQSSPASSPAMVSRRRRRHYQRQQRQLPPSPIIPRKSPARRRHLNAPNLPHLQFPGPSSVLSPRLSTTPNNQKEAPITPTRTASPLFDGPTSTPPSRNWNDDSVGVSSYSHVMESNDHDHLLGSPWLKRGTIDHFPLLGQSNHKKSRNGGHRDLLPFKPQRFASPPPPSSKGVPSPMRPPRAC
eukprot:Nitzschia sp. Nitz4//scaffold116_size91068//76186//77265//NITZ4_004967-RA/size91068-exonerate_est2genome-gene-0.17-mRNA-1//-1//CDS//3329533605//2451//frame0